MSEGWYQVFATLPMVGTQFVGWLWTAQYKAYALATSAPSACPGAGLAIYDQNGQPVAPPAGFPTIPGLTF